MTIPSGILKADVDKNDQAITQYLVVIDKTTGEPLKDPRRPDMQAMPVAVDVAGGQITVNKINDDGTLFVDPDSDSLTQENIAGLDIELHWIDDTPEWIVADYSGQELPEFAGVGDQPFSDTNAGGENDPDPDADDAAEPVMEGGVWKWGPGGEDIGPAELHEAGLCDSETCDWCGEEAEDGR